MHMAFCRARTWIQFISKRSDKLTVIRKMTTQQQPFLWPFVQDYTGEAVPEETFIHSHLSRSHTHKPFYGSVEFVRDSPGEPVPEETFTHYTHRGHQSYSQHSNLSGSSTIFYQLPPSTMIHSILHVQFMCLTVFFAQTLSKSPLVYLLVWNHPLHIPYISLPNHCLLSTTHTHTITTSFAVVPRLCHLFLVSL